MNATFKFTFTTREEYLAQAKEWSVAYAQAILQVRSAKINIKEANRKGTDIYAAYRGKREAAKAIEALQTTLRKPTRSTSSIRRSKGSSMIMGS